MKSFYNEIANNYKDISKKRESYINGVNKILFSRLKSKKKILDIGSGDGLRLETIRKKLKNSKFTAIESSLPMCKLFQKNSGIKLFNLDMRKINKLKISNFDAVICLWNVFGHLRNNKQRISVLKKIKKKMKPSSIFITDVNNRHNANSYGYLKVILRIILDFIFFHEKRGDIKYTFSVGKKKIKANGHLFTLKEFLKNLEYAGFKIIKIYPINYDNGKVMKTFLQGQLLFIAKVQ